MMHGKIGVSKHAKGNSGCTFRFGPVAAQVKDGQMTGADEFDGTIVGRAAHNQGGILPGQRALRKNSESTLAGQYAPLVVGRATNDGSVEFVSAGHLPVLHLGRNGAKSEGATGVPLGMFANANFPVHHLSLSADEALLVYTDGFTEACNPVSEEYGVNRVRDTAQRHYAATPDQLIAGCLSDLRNFAAGTKRTDDLSLLVLRRAA